MVKTMDTIKSAKSLMQRGYPMNFKEIDKKYRPIPFWSWNEKLNTDETRRQVEEMDKAGVGGYFMHARGGLLTEYMGEEWFDNIKVAIDEGNTRGMHPWAYDENGWPSGFGGGKVNGLGVEYQQKSLNIEPLSEENQNAENTLAIIGAYRYYYKVNEFYVDVLSRDVVGRFIEEIYAEYEKRAGKRFDGFFTDEPQLTRYDSFPWSFTLPEKFKEKYGYDLLPRLNELFHDEGDFATTRVDYWKLVTELFSENFFRQIYEWCISHGYQFTGHLLYEENLLIAMRANGAAMPHYEYFSIPGMDWLGRPIVDCLTPVAVGSVAAQLGKKQVLSETFACAGHNVSHGELKRIFEWQMVRGVNLLCTHLEGYSIRGLRKRDHPPALFYQQPWWEDTKIFFDAMSRIGMLLSEGEILADTLVIEPQSTAWKLYKGDVGEDASIVQERIMHYNNALLREMKTLEHKHILYHLGDEILMERHGSVFANQLVIGNMKYSRVIVPENLGLLPHTLQLLDEFRRGGGIVTSAHDLAPNPITEENALTYTMRHFEDFDLHYFVNSTDATVSATFTYGNLALDIVTGETYAFSGEHHFAPTESLVLIDTHEPRKKTGAQEKKEPLSLLGEWQLKSATYNSITLDKCDYYFDGELVARDGYVLDILPRINEKRRAVNLKQVYRFRAETIPETLFLCMETPAIFDITLNGTQISKETCGEFIDRSFQLLDILPALRLGENELRITSTIRQSDSTYLHHEKAWLSPIMKNSLSYDMEIEPVYIVGDFGAKLEGEMVKTEADSYRILHYPVICELPKTVRAEALDASGYPEFAGTLTLSRTFYIENTNLFVNLYGVGLNSIHLAINGQEVGAKMFAPYSIDISPYLKKGENRFELRILNNLRNMQGPHHMNTGENSKISPASFFRETNVFSHGENQSEGTHEVLPHYNEKISLVYFGLRDVFLK